MSGALNVSERWTLRREKQRKQLFDDLHNAKQDFSQNYADPYGRLGTSDFSKGSSLDAQIKYLGLKKYFEVCRTEDRQVIKRAQHRIARWGSE